MDFRRLRSIKPGDSAGLWRPCNQYASCVEGFFLEKQNQWWFLKYIYISIYLPIYPIFFPLYLENKMCNMDPLVLWRPPKVTQWFQHCCIGRHFYQPSHTSFFFFLGCLWPVTTLAIGVSLAGWGQGGGVGAFSLCCRAPFDFELATIKGQQLLEWWVYYSS